MATKKTDSDNAPKKRTPKPPVTVGDLIERKKPNDHGRNSPVIGENGLNLQPGDNAKYIRQGRILMELEPVDRKNFEQVKERIGFYFDLMQEMDMKPTVSGLAMSLGMNRQTLWCVVHNKPGSSTAKEAPQLPHEVSDLIKKAYDFMENMWENYASNGKINPIMGIFLAKNHYGYQDKSEYVVTPNLDNAENLNSDEIKARYIVVDEEKRLSGD